MRRAALLLSGVLLLPALALAEPPPDESSPQPPATVPSATLPTASTGAPDEKLRIGGYAKVGFLYEQADPNVDYIGHSNGFRMAAARLELTAHPSKRAEVGLSIEGAFDHPSDSLNVAGDKIVSLKDAYLSYEFFPFAVLTAGQFKAPYMAETLAPDADLTFFTRSVVEAGMLPPEGYAVDGLGLGRQLGTSLSSRRLELGPVGVTYALGIFNGNGPNRLLNDNRSMTPAGRMSVDFDQMVAVGVAATKNPHTVGNRPDLGEQVDTGYTADLSANLYGARALVSYTVRTRQHLEVVPQIDDEKANGLVAQASWRCPKTGLEVAYRFAQLAPTNYVTYYKVTQHTAGLNWKPSDQPVRIFAAYTLRLESADKPLNNNSFDLGAQLTF